MLSMPAAAADVAIHKLITVAPRNASRGLPTIQGAMTVFDPATGRPLLVLDGPTVTAARTAAVSMSAWRHLAPAGASRVLLIGTGAQAAAHVRAIAALHPDAVVRVRGTSREREAAFCVAHGEAFVDVGPDDGEDDADVVVTCTTSATPVWRAPARAGRLVIAVGAYRRGTTEVAAATVRASALWVDDRAGARHEAGDLIAAGVDASTVGSLADLVRAGPASIDRPALFKSVGCAAWDLAAARVALEAGGAAGVSP